MIQYTGCFSKINYSIVQYMYNHCLYMDNHFPHPPAPGKYPPGHSTENGLYALQKRGRCECTGLRFFRYMRCDQPPP